MVSIDSYWLFAILMVSTTVVCRACTNGEIHDNTVTDKDISDIIEAHNMYRSTVALGKLQNQPPAQDMQKMSWDDELSKRAQYWADQCVFEHDNERGEKVGQNLFISFWSGSHEERTQNFTQAITAWFDEHVYYSYKPLEEGDSSNPVTQTGHYTQVVWAKTNKVGCGFANFYQTQKQEDQMLYVCNYAPAGNYVGKYPYVEGKPDCKANGLSNSDTDGLCKK